MARNLDAKCRQCRREGEKLFLKGEKCFTDKCAVERRAYAPGQHGQKSGARLSDYGKARAALLAVLAGGVGAPLHRALVGEAFFALEEKLLAFPAALAALRVEVS